MWNNVYLKWAITEIKKNGLVMVLMLGITISIYKCFSILLKQHGIPGVGWFVEQRGINRSGIQRNSMDRSGTQCNDNMVYNVERQQTQSMTIRTV